MYTQRSIAAGSWRGQPVSYHKVFADIASAIITAAGVDIVELIAA